MQKLIFSLIMASRKLRHYFKAHVIMIVTCFPLQRILRNPEATGKIVEWALELSSFGLKFESASIIQSRALAEFIAEGTPTPDEEMREIVIPDKESPQEWIMYFDGAFSLQGAGWRASCRPLRGAREVHRPNAFFPGISNQQYI